MITVRTLLLERDCQIILRWSFHDGHWYAVLGRLENCAVIDAIFYKHRYYNELGLELMKQLEIPFCRHESPDEAFSQLMEMPTNLTKYIAISRIQALDYWCIYDKGPSQDTGEIGAWRDLILSGKYSNQVKGTEHERFRI